MWKMYAQQLEGWESAVQKIQGSSNGYQQRRLPPKPAMFAFCLKPRGRQLQIPSKGSKGPKQRSHKKLMYSGSHSFSREQDGFHRPGTSLMFCSQIIGSCFPPRPLFADTVSCFCQKYQAGDMVNMLGMGGQVNPMTVVLFIHQQGTLPGSL